MNHIVPYLNLLKDVATYFRHPAPIVILEIGVGRGHSTINLLKGLGARHARGHKGELYSIEIENCYNNVAGKIRRVKKKEDIDLDPHWHFIHEDSKKVDWDTEIDVLFIDGDHSYEGVKADYEKYEPFVKKGGLILMHDIAHPRYGVKDIWKTIKHQKVPFPLEGSGFGIIYKA